MIGTYVVVCIVTTAAEEMKINSAEEIMKNQLYFYWFTKNFKNDYLTKNIIYYFIRILFLSSFTSGTSNV